MIATNRTILHRVLIVIAAVIGAVSFTRASAASELKTPELLQAAIATADAGADTFTQCAKKADEEGLSGAASLFRAAARAQQVHETALTKALDGLSVKPDGRAKPKTFEVKTTRDNMTAVQAWLSEHQSVTLKSAIATARAEGQKDAETALNYNRQSFKELSKFFRTVGAALDDTREGKKVYYVDRTCGYTVDALDFQKCPVCNSTRDNFEKVD